MEYLPYLFFEETGTFLTKRKVCMGSEKPCILVVDDHLPSRVLLQEMLLDEGYDTVEAENGAKALEILQKNIFDIILLDIQLPDISGVDLCPKIKKIPFRSHIPIIFVTAYASIEIAVKAMETGAFYFLSKPIKQNELIFLIKRALEHSQLHREIARLKMELSEGKAICAILGKSKKIQELLKMVAQVAPYNTSVLIQGNSGTGKELVAKAIHQNSMRKNGPFVTIDCGTLSENLLESELFGHVKGAFTGAIAERKGVFVRANHGTLFLDEIGNLSLALQVKLLRVLQEHEILPLGSDKQVPVDVRIISATNMPLQDMVSQGTFRSDLYFRLNVVNIHLCDLKDRSEDIPILAHHFLQKYQSKNPVTGIAKSAIKLLLQYNWPGNVRELENAIERAMILASGRELEADDLPPEILDKIKKLSILEPEDLLANEDLSANLVSLEDMEKEHIAKVLQKTNYNQTQAANVLGIDRKSLWRKIKKFELEMPAC
ncbi:MAG: sigma-54-dependent Fis family transcriptional regulator [Candidatus Brocadiae bacterium]|nr:sigma-54-dependent Fis family transcriptional regulator [Candidatus Brocadiia bacterium]